MRSPETRARELAERLTAATGTAARTTRTPYALRVEVDVPAVIPAALLAELLGVLGTADRYGYDRTPDSGVAWAEITQE